MVTCAAIRLLHSMVLNLHYSYSTGTQAFQEILMHVCFDDCGRLCCCAHCCGFRSGDCQGNSAGHSMSMSWPGGLLSIHMHKWTQSMPCQ